MPSYHCWSCGRALKNLTSVKIGMGPVCRARDNKQGEFIFMRAQFEVLKHERGKYIYIRDIGQACRSVTNDAEHVIRQLFAEEEIMEDTRVFYIDSDGRTDEIIHAERVFKGFKAGHEGVEL